MKQGIGGECMKRSWHCKVMMALFLLLGGMTLLQVSTAEAADSKWIKQVWGEYQSYHKKTVDAYTNDQRQMEKVYQQFYNQSHQAFSALKEKVHADQAYWNEKLTTDLSELKEKYGSNRELADVLKEYERNISPNRSDSLMWKYVKESNPNYTDSMLWMYSTSINESYLNSSMWTYNKAINPRYLNSPGWKYSNAVNENYLNSPMWKLKNDSNSNYLNSPMWKYKYGKLSKEKAKKSYTALRKKHIKAVSAAAAANKKAIQATLERVRKEIGELHAASVRGLEQERENALLKLSELRKTICGEGLEWKPLLTDS